MNDRSQHQPLTESLDIHQQIIAAASGGILVYQASGGCVQANPAAATIVGGTVEQLLQQNFRQLKSWSESGMLTLAEHVLETGEPQTGEFHLVSTFGRALWIEGRFSSFGRPGERHLLLLAEDITEHKRTEERLLLSERNYKSLFDTITDAVYVQGTDGTFLEVNDGAVAMYGHPKEFFIGKTPECLSAPGRNDLRAVARAIQRAFSGEPQQFEWWGIRRNGEVFPKEVRLQVGTRFGAAVVIATGRDITDRQKVEAAWIESQALYYSLVENLPCSVFRKDAAGRFVFVNPRYCELKGLTESEILGKTPSETAAYQSARRTASPGALPGIQTTLAAEGETHHERIMRTGQFIELEEAYPQPDGTVEYYQAVKSPVFGVDGRVVGSQGIQFNITGRKWAEAALQQREQQLRALSHATQQINTVLKIPVVLRTLVASALEVTGATSGAAAQMIGDELVFTEYNQSGKLTPVDLRFKLDRGVPGWVMHTHQPYLANDAINDPHVLPEIQKRFGFRNLLDLPILNRAGTLLGCFEIHNKEGGFTEADTLILQGLAASAAVALENAALLLERQRAEAEIRTLNRLYNLLSRVNESIVRSHTREELFRHVCAAAVTQGGFKLAWVGWVDAATQAVVPVAFDGGASGYLQDLKIFADERPEGSGPIGVCLREGKPYVCNDFEKDPRFQPWLKKAQAQGLKACAALPLRSGGQVAGALMIYDEANDCFNEQELALLEEIAKDISFALDSLAARQKARQLTLAVEQSPASIVITDQKGRIEYVNPKFTEVTGYSAAEVLGQNPRILKSGEMATSEYRELWKTIFAGREWRGEFHNRKKNGEFFWELAAISPITDEHGAITHFLAVKEDITALKRLEAEFRQSQKMEAFGQLAAGVAHDFNNMLTAIRGNAEIVAMEDGLNAEQSESMREILLGTERAANLTRQLLMFSRRQAMQFKSLDLNAVVASVTKLLQRLIGEHIVLQTRFGAGDTPIHADPGMIEQVLVNLAVNARDAMPKGGELVIQTEAVQLGEAAVQTLPKARTGPFIRLSVQDTGCGISPANLEHIFEPFFTTKEIGKGTGLGLATVFGIVEQHKGWVEVESKVGTGTTFHIFLPRLETKNATDLILNGKPQPRGGTETILLVEDEASVRQLARIILTRNGYKIYEAASGVAALKVWTEHQADIDLLFTDMVMPEGLNGRELSERLKQDRPNLKVIFTSGYTDEMFTEGSALRHAPNFLEKPYSPAQILQKIRTCLDAG